MLFLFSSAATRARCQRSPLAEWSTKLARISGKGTIAAMGVRRNWRRCGGLEQGRHSRRRSSARGWGCCSSGSRRRRLSIVRVSDDDVNIISLLTLKLGGTTNDGHHSLVGLHSHSPLEPDFPNATCNPSKYQFVCSFTQCGVVISRVVCRMGFRVHKVTSCKLMLTEALMISQGLKWENQSPTIPM